MNKNIMKNTKKGEYMVIFLHQIKIFTERKKANMCIYLIKDSKEILLYVLYNVFLFFV